MKQTLYFFILLIMFVNCEKTDQDLSKKVYEIRNIGELATTEYTIGKVIKFEDLGEDYEWLSSDWYKVGDRKILISCKAKVKAGIDFTEIKEGDIEIIGNKIIIRMPPVKIISFSMDPNLIHTEMETVNGLRDNFTQKEKNNFLKQGEAAIKKDLINTGLFDDATKNGKIFLEEFYHELGYDKVIVNSSTPNL